MIRKALIGAALATVVAGCAFADRANGPGDSADRTAAGVGMSDSSAAMGAVGGSVMLQGPVAENVWLPGHLLD
jgi:hypothetical protein